VNIFARSAWAPLIAFRVALSTGFLAFLSWFTATAAGQKIVIGKVISANSREKYQVRQEANDIEEN